MGIDKVFSALNDISIFLFSFRKENAFGRIIQLIILLVSIIIVIFILESITGIITLGRLERQVNLLNNLYELTEKGLGNQHELEIIHSEMVSGLKAYDPSITKSIQNLFPANSPLEKPTVAEKFLPAFMVWTLLSVISVIWFMPTESNRANKIFVFVIFTLMSVGMGFIASILVDTQSTILNMFLSAIIGLSPFIIAVIIQIKKGNHDDSNCIIDIVDGIERKLAMERIFRKDGKRFQYKTRSPFSTILNEIDQLGEEIEDIVIEVNDVPAEDVDGETMSLVLDDVREFARKVGSIESFFGDYVARELVSIHNNRLAGSDVDKELEKAHKHAISMAESKWIDLMRSKGLHDIWSDYVFRRLKSTKEKTQ